MVPVVLDGLMVPVVLDGLMVPVVLDGLTVPVVLDGLTVPAVLELVMIGSCAITAAFRLAMISNFSCLLRLAVVDDGRVVMRGRAVMRGRGVVDDRCLVGHTGPRGEKGPILKGGRGSGDRRDELVLTAARNMLTCERQDGVQCAQHGCLPPQGLRRDLVIPSRPRRRSSVIEGPLFSEADVLK